MFYPKIGKRGQMLFHSSSSLPGISYCCSLKRQQPTTRCYLAAGSSESSLNVNVVNVCFNKNKHILLNQTSGPFLLQYSLSQHVKFSCPRNENRLHMYGWPFKFNSFFVKFKPVELDCPPSKIKTILKLQIKKGSRQKREAHFCSDNT